MSQETEFNVTRLHVLNCSLPRWILDLKALTIPTKVIPFPANFVDYLLEDGIQLLENNDLPDGSWSDDEDSRNVAPAVPSLFPELAHQIQDAITQLGGDVVPKLNWSAPKDAVFMNFNRSLRCSTVNDVITLLKSSEFITHDLVHAWDECVDKTSEMDGYCPSLVLRQYISTWHASLEFRCFVHNHQLIAACQRDIDTSYDHLNDSRSAIQACIISFYKSITFAESSYVFDVYLSPSLKKATLIDINPWCQRTDTLLFTWEELFSLEKFSFKLLTDTESRLKPSGIHSYYGYPVKDLMFLAKNKQPSMDIEKIIDALNRENEVRDTL